MKKTIIFALLALLGMTQAVAKEYEGLLLVREGVKWVNEKVIIDHGDTTSYYYTYEFSGYDMEEAYFNHDYFNALYYYTGESLDVERDSLIAGLYNTELLYDNFHGYNVFCYRNNALEKISSEQRQLLPLPSYIDTGADGLRRELYQFGKFDDGHDNAMEFYFMIESWAQEVRPPFLTTDNFIEVEPVEIEGVSCHRYAYINEQGEPQCYVVEGIGFDSRDMGDLLTPFTRKPDPDADYQEWCGLSHVIKDGKIIYKGLRYREDAFDGIDEVAEGQTLKAEGNYYDLMGRAVGKEVPSAPGIYIHQGKKIVIR